MLMDWTTPLKTQIHWGYSFRQQARLALYVPLILNLLRKLYLQQPCWGWRWWWLRRIFLMSNHIPQKCHARPVTRVQSLCRLQLRRINANSLTTLSISSRRLESVRIGALRPRVKRIRHLLRIAISLRNVRQRSSTTRLTSNEYPFDIRRFAPR